MTNEKPWVPYSGNPQVDEARRHTIQLGNIAGSLSKSATATRNSPELTRLASTNHALVQGQNRLAAIQSRSLGLQKEQARLQREQLQTSNAQLDVQRQLLASQQLNNVFAQITAANMERQTEIQEAEKLHRDRQRHLKEAIFYLRRVGETALSNKDSVVRYMNLVTVLAEFEEQEIEPNDLEEIKDKEYAHETLSWLKQNEQAVVDALDGQDCFDLETMGEVVPQFEELRASRQSLVGGLSETKKQLDQVRGWLVDSQGSTPLSAGARWGLAAVAAALVGGGIYTDRWVIGGFAAMVLLAVAYFKSPGAIESTVAARTKEVAKLEGEQAEFEGALAETTEAVNGLAARINELTTRRGILLDVFEFPRMSMGSDATANEEESAVAECGTCGLEFDPAMNCPNCNEPEASGA